MQRSTFVFVLLFISLLVVSAVFAVVGFDDQGNPNDPRVNERANACYDGGTLSGKCDTQAEWDAGWYLIRLEYGLIACGDFPRHFSWVAAFCSAATSTGGGQIGPVLPTSTPTNMP